MADSAGVVALRHIVPCLVSRRPTVSTAITTTKMERGCDSREEQETWNSCCPPWSNTCMVSFSRNPDTYPFEMLDLMISTPRVRPEMYGFFFKSFAPLASLRSWCRSSVLPLPPGPQICNRGGKSGTRFRKGTNAGDSRILRDDVVVAVARVRCIR
eukprot:scaffold697_cov235-Pinguiococcus_pyrenoidosus.AAC.2